MYSKTELVVLIAAVIAVLGSLLIPPLFGAMLRRKAVPNIEISTLQTSTIPYEVQGTTTDTSSSEIPGVITKTRQGDLVSCVKVDPNKAPLHELLAAGLPDRVARNIIAYRKAGGIFRLKSDLLRIYGLDSTVYTDLQDCIVLTEKSITPSLIEVNTADSADWISIKGIGPVLAGRIIRFRNGLGGFHSVEQVRETYGLPPETYSSMASSLTLSVPHRKIPLRHTDAKTLAAHPYLSWKDARHLMGILKQRQISNAEEFLVLDGLKEETRRKILPYLDFTSDTINQH